MSQIVNRLSALVSVRMRKYEVRTKRGIVLLARLVGVGVGIVMTRSVKERKQELEYLAFVLIVFVVVLESVLANPVVSACESISL